MVSYEDSCVSLKKKETEALAKVIYFSSTKQGKIGRSYAHYPLAGLASAENYVHTNVYTCMQAYKGCERGCTRSFLQAKLESDLAGVVAK